MDYDLHLDDATHRIFAAPARRGKSRFVGACAEQLYQQQHPFIVFDTKTDNQVGLISLKEVELLKVYPGMPLGRENLKTPNTHPYVVCVPARRDYEIEDIIKIYRKIMSYMWMQPGERFFICEEAHNYNKNASVPDKIFEKIAREGAGYKKYIWWITQSLQFFNPLLRRQCGYTYLWKMNSSPDIAYARKMVTDFEKLNPELGIHDVLVWDAGEKHS